MKKLIFVLTAALALAACAKEQQEPVPTPMDAGDVPVSFVAEENSAQTRAFFDASATTESWEKSLSSISLFCFDTDGSLTVRRKSENGTILRNDYYRVTVSPAGLTGQDVNTTITVADWETPVTQNINLGQ